MANTKVTSNVIADNAVGITQLNVSDGSNGQALVTNGSGTLSFASVGVSGVNSSADADAIFIDSSENVGIGSSTINAKFNVHGTIRAENDRFLAGREDAAAPAYAFHDDADTGMFNVASNILCFSTSGTERMRIDASGNVGIGETSPAKLGLTGSSNGKVLHLGGDDAQLRLTYTILHHDHSGNTTTTLRNHYGSLDSLARMKLESGYISFHTGTAFNEKMRLNADGRLIIGRTSVIQSDNHLTVSGSGTGAGNAIQDIRNTSTSDTCGCLSLSKASTTTSSANRYIWFFANNFGSNMGAIGGAGLNNVQFIASSDERLKENITPITGSLNKILALNPVSFDWKQNGEHRDAGFVAQEVENVYPEYVITDDDEMKTKNIGGGMTAGFVAELTKAIQEQQTIIEDLKSRIETLEG